MPDTPSKFRVDSWYARLSESERWSAYDKARSLPWQRCAEWAAKEFQLAAPPSRSAWYRFLDHMRGLERAHRVEQAIVARREAGELADKAGAQRETADAFRALAVDIALRTGDASDAAAWIKMSAAMVAAAQRDQELKLRGEAQRLDREKFEAAERRLAAVQEAVKSAKAAGGGLSEESLRKIEEAAGLL